jgi:hypothetical protein
LSFRLSENYPNPFNPQTTIRFSIPHESFVSLTIYDVLGKEVACLVNERKQPGEYVVTWKADAQPSGMYFYHLQAGSRVETKKLLLVK